MTASATVNPPAAELGTDPATEQPLPLRAELLTMGDGQA